MPVSSFQNRIVWSASNGLWPGAPKDPHQLPGGIGPMWLQGLLDFTNGAGGSNGQPIADTLFLDEEMGRIGSIQTIFIDNAIANAGAFTITFGNSLHRIGLQAKFQGILPVISPT